MRKKKILIVDDEKDILSLFKEVLEAEGYEVWVAENAEDALNILQTQSILVMFLDLKLPGMSGVDLCKKIRTENQIGIIYAMTGYSNFYGLLECRSAGFDDFFTKPVQIKTLLKAVQDAFEKLTRWKIEEYDL